MVQQTINAYERESQEKHSNSFSNEPIIHKQLSFWPFIPWGRGKNYDWRESMYLCSHSFYIVQNYRVEMTY